MCIEYRRCIFGETGLNFITLALSKNPETICMDKYYVYMYTYVCYICTGPTKIKSIDKSCCPPLETGQVDRIETRTGPQRSLSIMNMSVTVCLTPAAKSHWADCARRIMKNFMDAFVIDYFTELLHLIIHHIAIEHDHRNSDFSHWTWSCLWLF